MLPEVLLQPVDNVLKPVYEMIGVTPPSAPGGITVVKPVPTPNKSKDPLEEENLFKNKQKTDIPIPQNVDTKKEEAKKVLKSEVKPKVEVEKKPAVTKSVKEETKTPEPEAEAAAATIAMGVVAKAVHDKDIAEKSQAPQPSESESKKNVLEKEMNELISRVEIMQTDAIASIDRMRQARNKHTDALRTALDTAIDGKNKDLQWKDVSEKFQLREKAEELSAKLVSDARAEIDKLHQVVSDAKTMGNNALIKKLDRLKQVQEDITALSSQAMKEEQKGIKRIKELADEAKTSFKKELSTIMPELKLGQGKLSEEDLNTMLAHAHKKIEQLQLQLAHSIALDKERIKEATKMRDDKMVRSRVMAEADKIKKAYLAEKQHWDENAQVRFEEELRQSLARQAAAHNQHLNEAIKQQRLEVEVEMERKQVMDMLEQKQKFHEEVDRYLARLKGIEKAVTNQAEAEKLSKCAQQLWLASSSMSSIIQNGRIDQLVWEDKLHPLANEVVSIAQASLNHPFVSIVLSTIPEEACERGVWTEDVLKQRFRKVQNVCKKVAMVDSTQSSLRHYLFSYLASFVIHPRVTARKEDEEVDVASMDNYDLLANAQYWIEEGKFELAVRFMNQLTGESKKVAAEWLHEAKLLLETRQAANALVAFSAAEGLNTWPIA